MEMDLDGMVVGEELGELEMRESESSIYCIKKNLFSIKEKIDTVVCQ